MNIVIKNHFLLYKDYKLKCSVGKSGITNFKKEGDLSTPKGLFKLGLLYYRKDRIRFIKSKIKKRVIKKNMGWCNDIRSKKYNQEIHFPFIYNAEKLFKKKKIYDIFINIEYNQFGKRINNIYNCLFKTNSAYLPSGMVRQLIDVCDFKL